MKMLRVLVLVAVVCAVNVDQLYAEQNSGSQESRRASRYQHLKQQFELFKRELDSLFRESNGGPETDEEEIEVPAQGEEDGENLEKRCHECDDDNGDNREKRCPSGCKKGGKPKPKPARTVDCEKRCPTCTECQDDKSAPIPQSEMMKRFLKALPSEDRRLVESSKSKRQFIERLIRRSHYGPNANDVAAEKAREAERVNAIANIGVRSLPDESSGVMLALKRTLDPSDQELLTKFKSKTRFIQGVLEKQPVHDSRDVDVPNTSNEKKRQLDDPIVAKYLEKLDDSQKALIKQHPSVAEHLKKAILEGNRANANEQEKRELSPDEAQVVLSRLANREDAELFKQHMSKLEKLAEAQKRPVGNPDEEVEQVVSRFVTDIKAAKKRGLNLEQLLAAMKKRADEHKASP